MYPISHQGFFRGPWHLDMVLGFLNAIGLFISIRFTPTLHLLMRLLMLWMQLAILGTWKLETKVSNKFYLFLTTVTINSSNQPREEHTNLTKKKSQQKVLILLGFLFQITFHVLGTKYFPHFFGRYQKKHEFRRNKFAPQPSTGSQPWSQA